MQIDVISANQLTEQHVADWANLQQSHGMFDNPFFRPEYAQIAARVIPHVEVAVIKQNDATVGFFPFERDGHNVGRPVGTLLSDLHGVIVSPEMEWTAEELLRQSGLNAWRFDHLIASQPQFSTHHSFVDDSPYMDLRGGFERYKQQRVDAGSSVIRQSDRKQRKLEREIGQVRFTAHTSDEKYWHQLIDWKQLQLSRQGFTDMFRLAWVNNFLEELRLINGDVFSPMLSTLHAGDQLLAVHLALRSHRVISSWIPTYDYHFSNYSPGLILHVELARWAAEKGIDRIDLCRGENQMKTSLMSAAFPVAIGSVDRRIIQRTLTRSYYGLRNLIHAAPFRETSTRAIRVIRNRLSRC